MRVKYIFSSRRTRRLDNIRKQRGKFPKLLEKVSKSSDIILEILDARFIKETRNEELEESLKKENKSIIYVLNKSDLIDQKKSKENLKNITPYVFVSCKKRTGIKELRNKIKIAAKKINKQIDINNKITIGVIGYPNTGKSSLINLLIGKNSAKTGRDAGFTKGIQKLKLNSEIILLDSPGVIPQKEYSSIEKSAISQHTKVGGRSYSQVKEPEIIVTNLLKEFPNIEKHYKIEADGDSEILIEKLGERKGFLKKGGVVDCDKTARLILKDWQDGKIKV